MLENNDNSSNCHCECCHCKKIFMLLVLLMLAFIAGIMVGCCTQNSHNYQPQIMMHHKHHDHKAKMHRGMHQNNLPATNQQAPSPNAQMESYSIEIDTAE